MTTGTRRRIDRLARHMGQSRNSAAPTAMGGRCHDDPEHVAQVLEELAQCGALGEVLEGAGLAIDALSNTSEE